MIALENKIKLNEDTLKAINLCDRFSNQDLDTIGETVYEGYLRDKQSRFKWERRTQAAMDLAMQVQKDKNFPWPGASSIAFPLVTIASLQFHSRSYPAIISGTDVVKCRVIGDDSTGQKTARADRISSHMSWQVLEEDTSWEEQKDRLLLNLPIVGTVFTKSYWSAEANYIVSETVLAQDLVIDYWTKSLEKCPRKTHIIPYFRNQLHTNMKSEVFRDVSGEAWYGIPPQTEDSTQDEKKDNRQGMTPGEPDDTTPYILLEQHVDLDLDGDGYAEPYIITIEQTSKCVLRIVVGFERMVDVIHNIRGEVVSVQRMEYFTKYLFIPSPDGGVYGVGFGVLLGPLNEATNSLINQLVDAGTWSITTGGFLGRGAKIRGGTNTFAPREWKRIDSTGDDLRKSIVPLDVREPNGVLLQLLTLLINYVERLSGTTDPMVGENPGQNTTAETMRTMVQEGQRVYSAVFKRVWRCMKDEFKLRYILNGIYMPVKKRYKVGALAQREDYLGNPDEVAPAADPNITSDQMQMAQVQVIAQRASTVAGYDPEQVERRLLKAMKVDAIDQIYPGAKKTGSPEDPRIAIQKLKNEAAGMQLQAAQARFAAELTEQQRLNSAEIFKIAAEIENMKSDQLGDVEDRQISGLNAILGMLKLRNEQLGKRADHYIKLLEMGNEQREEGNTGNVLGLAGAPSDGASQGGFTEQQAGIA